MTLATVLCTYIYNAFVVIKTTLEAGLIYAKTIISTLDSLVMSIELMINNTILVVLDAALATFQILCKYITDWILQKTHGKAILDKFCKSMFKCSYLLKEILNPNSVIAKTLTANFNYDTEKQTELYSIISNFDAFRSQVCSAGFTFVIGLDYLQEQATDIITWVNEQVEVVTRCRNRIRKFLERYVYAIEDYGIMDLLNKLTSFFSCVLSDADTTCAALASTKNFYKNCCAFFHIKDIGFGQYALSDSWVKSKLGACDSVTSQLNSLSDKLSIAFNDMGVSAKNLSASMMAYNLADYANKIWKKLKDDEGAWSKLSGWDAICDAWDSAKKMGTSLKNCFTNMEKNKDKLPDSAEYTFDYIVENSVIDEYGDMYIGEVKIMDNAASIVKPIDIAVDIETASSAEMRESLNHLIKMPDNSIITVGTGAIAVFNRFKGVANDEAHDKIATDIINIAEATFALSDVTAILKAHN